MDGKIDTEEYLMQPFNSNYRKAIPYFLKESICYSIETQSSPKPQMYLEKKGELAAKNLSRKMISYFAICLPL